MESCRNGNTLGTWKSFGLDWREPLYEKKDDRFKLGTLPMYVDARVETGIVSKCSRFIREFNYGAVL